MNRQGRWALVALLLGLGYSAEALIEKRIGAATSSPSAALTRPLAEFPETIGSWTGADLPIDDRIKKVIGGDDYLQREYRHPTGERCVLWMSYSCRSKDQYHFPTICMAGGGWIEQEADRHPFHVVLGADRLAPLYRMLFTKPQETEFVYYWYYLMGEDELDRLMRRMSGWARSLIRGRRNGSLTVEVFSRSSQPSARLLDEFASEVARALESHLPNDSVPCRDLGSLH